MQHLAAQGSRSGIQDYYGSAVAKAEQVVSENSDNYRDLIWLGQLRWAANQPAEPLFRRAIALAKDAPEARLALILYLAGTDRKADAEAALEASREGPGLAISRSWSWPRPTRASGKAGTSRCPLSRGVGGPAGRPPASCEA